MMRRVRVVTGFVLLAHLSGCAGPSLADDTVGKTHRETASEKGSPSASPLAIEAITVEPPNPGPDTLCKLRVMVHNRGHQAASRFRFRVEINGVALPIYDNQLFLQPIAAGERKEILLFNLWSSEAGRPFPVNGQYTVEVSLEAATWIRVEPGIHGESRIPLGPVLGLLRRASAESSSSDRSLPRLAKPLRRRQRQGS